jgi:hypothetical protein
LFSVISTYTVGYSRPLCLFGNIPLTIVLQTKSEEGLTKQAMAPIVSSLENPFIKKFVILFLYNDKNNFKKKSIKEKKTLFIIRN